MPIPPKRLERLSLLALLSLLGLVVYFWNPVLKAHQRTHNTLGQTGAHIPTADLFLYTVFALILYGGSRMWSAIARRVFELSPERAAAWQTRLLWFRFLSTTALLALTLVTISRI